MIIIVKKNGKTNRLDFQKNEIYEIHIDIIKYYVLYALLFYNSHYVCNM